MPKILADGHTIRILVNCAGIQIRHPVEEFPDGDFNQVSTFFLSPAVRQPRESRACVCVCICVYVCVCVCV